MKHESSALTGGEPLAAPSPGEHMEGGVPHGAGEDHRRAARSLELITRARSLSGRLPGGWDRRARDLGKAIVNYRGGRRAYARQAVFAAVRRVAGGVLVPFGEGQLLVPTDDQEIGRVVFASGGYERLYMAAAMGELERLGMPVKGMTFVDVGANIGTSTVDALLAFGFAQAVCFEPDPRSFRLLMANVAVNGLHARVRAHPVALSATAGTDRLHLSLTNRADNRIVGDEERPSAHSGPVVDIACERFDDVVARGEIELEEVGVLWLDAQGHEPLVLQGAGRALEAGIPLVMEYTPAALEAAGSLAALEAMIQSHYTTVVDLHLLSAGLRSQAILEAADIRRLRSLDREHTDLLLVRLPASNG